MKKPPLLFLHGFLGSPSDFDLVCSHLENYEHLFIELPGHGKAPFIEDPTSLFPKTPVHLIGYSMGGRLAMQYAVKHPNKIASLTILSAHSGLQKGRKERLQRDIDWSKKIAEDYPLFLDAWYRQEIFNGFKPNLSTRKNHNPSELAKTLIHYSVGNQEILSPKHATFVVGEYDKKYRKLYPNGIVVPGAAHMIHLENPEFVAKVIENVVENSNCIYGH